MSGVPARATRPRIALVSIGIGRVQRGFERYFGELFRVLGAELPVVLFRSAGGSSAAEVVPPRLRWATAVARRLPLGGLAGRSEYARDCLAFAIAMAPRLARERFDVIHCIDPPMAYALRHVKRLARLRARLLFTEGTVMPPGYYPRADLIHHVAPGAHAAAVAHGVPPEAMALVPCGVDTARFPDRDDAIEVRRRHGVAPGTFVVLVVSAVKRDHKRVDHVIDEVARLEGDVLLWLDGNPEDAVVVEHARARLGSRVRITHVASEEVPALYRAADVMAHAALEESFGLSIVEAACSGTPVLVHDSPHFEWLLGDRGRLVDMREAGALAARLREVAGARLHERASARERAAAMRRRFDWQALVPRYLEMYERVCAEARAPATPACVEERG